METSFALEHAMSRTVPTPKIVTKPTESAVPRGTFGKKLKKESGGNGDRTRASHMAEHRSNHCTSQSGLKNSVKLACFEIRPKRPQFHSGHRLL